MTTAGSSLLDDHRHLTELCRALQEASSQGHLDAVEARQQELVELLARVNAGEPGGSDNAELSIAIRDSLAAVDALAATLGRRRDAVLAEIGGQLNQRKVNDSYR